jgi:hypothetical protein
LFQSDIQDCLEPSHFYFQDRHFESGFIQIVPLHITLVIRVCGMCWFALYFDLLFCPTAEFIWLDGFFMSLADLYPCLECYDCTSYFESMIHFTSKIEYLFLPRRKKVQQYWKRSPWFDQLSIGCIFWRHPYPSLS